MDLWVGKLFWLRLVHIEISFDSFGLKATKLFPECPTCVIEPVNTLLLSTSSCKEYNEPEMFKVVGLSELRE